MKDKYIPELIMSVLHTHCNDEILNSPVFKVDSYRNYEPDSNYAIRLCELKKILDDIFKDEKE